MALKSHTCPRKFGKQRKTAVKIQEWSDRSNFVLVCNHPVTGKKIVRSSHTKDPEEAQQKARELEKEIDDGMFAGYYKKAKGQRRSTLEACALKMFGISVQIEFKRRGFRAVVLRTLRYWRKHRHIDSGVWHELSRLLTKIHPDGYYLDQGSQEIVIAEVEDTHCLTVIKILRLKQLAVAVGSFGWNLSCWIVGRYGELRHELPIVDFGSLIEKECGQNSHE